MNKIRELRRKMGLTQVELANALNISQGSLSGYETGRIEPLDDIDQNHWLFVSTAGDIFTYYIGRIIASGRQQSTGV